MKIRACGMKARTYSLPFCKIGSLLDPRLRPKGSRRVHCTEPYRVCIPCSLVDGWGIALGSLCRAILDILQKGSMSRIGFWILSYVLASALVS